MQLVAYGAQDIYLTGNPQITFFKVVYRRHTNFSMECIQQTIQGANTTAGGSGTVTVSRNGDLVYKVYVTSSSANITTGDAIVQQVDLEIGGQLIDRQYAEWHRVWDELTTPDSKATALKLMKCDAEDAKHASGASATQAGVGYVQIPLKFWFCRNPGLALPLIALQYHEVKLKFTWGTAAQVSKGVAAPSASTCQVWADYIYLDTDERRRFAQVSHEYLIEQLQKDTYTTGAGDKKLNFNHPVKELIWVSASANAYGTAKLTLNGHDRFAAQEEEYFQLRQPYDYHTAVPQNNLPASHSLLQGAESNSLHGSVPGVHTDNKGLDSIAIGAGDLTLVTIGGSAEPRSIASNNPANASTFANATTEASAFLVGAFDDNSCIKPNSLRVGQQLYIEIHDDSANTYVVFTPKITGLFSNHTNPLQGQHGVVHKSEVDTGNDAFDPDRLRATSATTDLTDDVARALLVTLDTKATFPILESTRDVIFVADAGDGMHARTSNMTKKINVYSFALKPEEHQPSGTCNFSRIDSAKLNFSADPVDAGNIYAVNYNVLRIMSGMGGLAYSN